MNEDNNDVVIKGALLHGAKLLNTASIPNGYLESSLLLGYILNLSREKVLLNRDEVLADTDWHLYNDLLSQRAAHKPLSHIIGVKNFWKHEFKVTGDVLDPRADSETLIETVLKYRPDVETPYSIIDFGTGTGCLILSLLDEYKNSQGIAVDKSTDAIKVAKENSKRLNISNRISFINESWDNEINFSGQKFDIIISNPPYIPTEDIANLQDNVKNYEPHLALDGGDDGMDCYRKLIPVMKSIMSDHAICVIEIGINQEDDLQKIIEENVMEVKGNFKDLAGVVRCIAFA